MTTQSAAERHLGGSGKMLLDQIIADRQERENANASGRRIEEPRYEKAISEADLKSLKTSTGSCHSMGFLHSILKAISDVWSMATLMTEGSKSNSMCKFYGHVKAGGSWQGAYPKCSDCGIEIISSQQLRRAFLLPEHIDK
jgi:hypothetical protein